MIADTERKSLAANSRESGEEANCVGKARSGGLRSLDYLGNNEPFQGVAQLLGIA
jgi:hypothetical protein